jgi:CubicO group peptidase (beta-lactamase class C family)
MKELIPFLIFLLFFNNPGFSRDAEKVALPDTAKFEAFFDGLIGDHLRTKHVAGAVVALVKEGKVIFKKGYGYSNYSKKEKVNPDSTLFRIGSISKTFTWTAIMQLVGQGKLSLDEDINSYLRDFKIPEGFNGPVTLRHLMTHTPGFEDRLMGLFFKDSLSVKPSSEVLTERLPVRVRPAGTEISYSNFGTGIAANIIEEVSGLPFEEYISRNILIPLGMKSTSFRQPLPASLSSLVSKGYSYEGGKYSEKDFEIISLTAAGGASSTASDMAAFMIAHLSNGRYNDTIILDSLSSARIRGLEFRVSPYVSGIGLGMFELINWNGIRTVGHAGDTFWFHSLMAFIPETGTGLFVSFNSQGADYSQVFGSFLDYLYPRTELIQEKTISEEEAEKFTGEFRYNRYPHSDLTKLAAISGTVNIIYGEVGQLVTVSGEESTNWYQLNDSTFIKESGEENLVFWNKVNGKFTRACFGNLAVMPLERVPFSERKGLSVILLTTWLSIFLFTLIYWPVSFFIRRKYILVAGSSKPLTAGVKVLNWSVSLAAVIFVAGFAGSLSDIAAIMQGAPPLMKTVLFLPFLLIVLLPFLVFNAYKASANNKVGISGKVHLWLIIISLLIMLWQLFVWNLLGFKY